MSLIRGSLVGVTNLFKYYFHEHHTFVKISEGPDAIKQGSFHATK